jgi:CRP-like cAMP-binding protein
MPSSSETSLSPLVKKLRNWAPVTEDDENAILALPHRTARIAIGEYIVRDGDIPTQCCVVVEGFAMRHKVIGDGRRQILNIHMAGDILDLQNSLLEVADHNVQALTPMAAAFISREAIVDLAFARPSVGKALWKETLVDGSIAGEWIANVGRRDSRARVAHLLCELAMRLAEVELGTQCRYDLPLTQEQIADALGLTPVHVNRTLKSLDSEGLTTRSRRSIMIRDWQGLAEAADFNPRYLHLPAHPA